MCKITWCASLEPVFESPAHTLKVGCVCKCTGFQHWVVSTDKGRLLRFVICRSSSVRGPAAREQGKVVEQGSLPPALCLHAHRVPWLVCTSPRHKQESSWKREPQLRKKCPPHTHQIGLWANLWYVFLMENLCGRAQLMWMVPSQAECL